LIIAVTCLIAIAVFAFILTVRPKDLPVPEPESPFRHLDERKVAIYENLRDLQFEYRLGKLSDDDYQTTKKDLQKELARLLAEVDRIRAGQAPEVVKASEVVAKKPEKVVDLPPRKSPDALVCPSCGAAFDKPLKFCGECGKPMRLAQ
jgi:hypothetical protein